MGDPRNVAHAKKVSQEKHHKDKHASKTGSAPAQRVRNVQTEKDLEFHSRANIEKLAELSLTIEEELKQKAFAEAIGAVYAAQDAFQSKILKLIEDYEAECTRLKPAG
jgi:hypothetical protein